MNIKGALTSMVLALGLVSSPAYSYVLTDGTDVGGLDTFIASESWTGNGGEAAETTWASAQATSFAGTDVFLTFSDKSEPAYFQLIADDASVIAFELFSEPSYFLVKDGNKRVLFKNEANIDWGVFTLFDYFPGKDGLQLSHLTEFSGGGDDVTVTEPGTLALFGLALTGLVIARRRQKS